MTGACTKQVNINYINSVAYVRWNSLAINHKYSYTAQRIYDLTHTTAQFNYIFNSVILYSVLANEEFKKVVKLLQNISVTTK